MCISIGTLGLLGWPSCLAYNTCTEDKGAYLGNAALDLDLRENIIRKTEAPIGNLVSDAFLDYSRQILGCTPLPLDMGETIDFSEIGTSGQNCPVIALQNAGGIRQETECGLRELIPEGPLYEKDIEDMLPFSNELWVVRLKGKDIKLLLEHSVESLGIIGIASEVGHFLQVSGLSFQVDCEASPQVLSADQKQITTEGQRIQNILVGRGAALTALENDTEYEVITNQFIAAGNDGFLGFLQRDDQNIVLTNSDDEPLTKAVPEQDIIQNGNSALLDSQAVKDWIETQHQDGQTVGRTAHDRITLSPACTN
jgi:2',3'-cyclic-nucleotide 2'-phosphodiesterase (5'-nucleotidase family)